MMAELREDEIKEITVAMLEKLIESGKTMAVLFYDPDQDQKDQAWLEELEKIDDDCSRHEISFVKVSFPSSLSFMYVQNKHVLVLGQ